MVINVELHRAMSYHRAVPGIIQHLAHYAAELHRLIASQVQPAIFYFKQLELDAQPYGSFGQPPGLNAGKQITNVESFRFIYHLRVTVNRQHNRSRAPCSFFPLHFSQKSTCRGV